MPSKFVNESGAVELGVSPGDPGNPDLKPERGKEFEAGFDAGFFDDRVGLELTYFNKKSDDLIVAVPTAPSSGFGGSIANIGEVQNTRFEFLLRAQCRCAGRTSRGTQRSTAARCITRFSSSARSARSSTTSARSPKVGRSPRSGRTACGALTSTGGKRDRIGHGRVHRESAADVPGEPDEHVTLFKNIRVYALLEGKTGYYSYNVNQENRDGVALNTFDVVNPADKGGYSPEERLRRLGPYVSEKTGATSRRGERERSVHAEGRSPPPARSQRDVPAAGLAAPQRARVRCVDHASVAATSVSGSPTTRVTTRTCSDSARRPPASISSSPPTCSRLPPIAGSSSGSTSSSEDADHARHALLDAPGCGRLASPRWRSPAAAPT